MGILVLAERALTAAQLIRLAAPIGLAASNLKSQLTRMVQEGSLVRCGRVRLATYSPSSAQKQIILGIKARLMDQPKRSWDNTWFMLTVRLPANRTERDRLRASLLFDGFRPVSLDCFARPAWPLPWAEKKLRTYLAAGAFCVRGRVVWRMHSTETLYDLQGLDSEARRVLEWLRRQRGSFATPCAAFVAQMEAGGRLAQLVGHDPRLPPAVWGKRRAMTDLIREYRNFEKIVAGPARRFIEET
jgi:DNA-binding transcriptional regulator PaaX